MKTTIPDSTEESARLRFGEMVIWAELLQHNIREFSQESRDVVNQNVEQLQRMAKTTNPGADECDPEAMVAVRDTQQAIEGDWLNLEVTVDELIGRAIDAINKFAAATEIRVGACERKIRHLRTLKQIHGSTDGERP